MYTEIIKIIEGGLSGDREKVYNYAKTLSGNLSLINSLKHLNFLISAFLLLLS